MLKRSQNQIEAFTLRLDENGSPISLAGTTKKTLGSSLGKAISLDFLSPVVSYGPFIVRKQSNERKVSNIEEKEETQDEEPSFLRKYWWLIVGAMLLSSVLSPNDPSTQGSATTRQTGSS